MTKKTIQQTPDFGLCLDWETSGATWGGDSSIDYQGISFGAVVFSTKTFEPVETLHVIVKFNADKYKWTEQAENIHGMSQEFLAENGISQEDAAAALLELIAKYFPGTKVMFMGHNNEFDRRFTNQLFNTIGVEFTKEASGKFDTVVELHHVIIDTAAVGFVSMGLFKSDLLFEAVGLAERGKHNALEDALMTLETCRRIRMLVDTALNG